MTWKKGFRLVLLHGSKLHRAFREIYPGDVCWTIRCREKLFHGIVWTLWKGSLWRKKGEFWLGFEPLQILMHDYISSIEFDTHGKLLRPAITNSWDLLNKKSSFTAGQGAIKIHDFSRFFGGVKIVASLASLENSKWPWHQVEESKTFLHFLDTGGPQVSREVDLFEDKLDLPLPVTTRMTLHFSVRESQPKPSFATKILGGG